MEKRKISSEKLKKILAEHSKWLKDPRAGKRADLRDADLRDVNLRSANLRSANLRGADLRNTNLSNVDLWGADLSNVKISIGNRSITIGDILSEREEQWDAWELKACWK